MGSICADLGARTLSGRGRRPMRPKKIQIPTPLVPRASTVWSISATRESIPEAVIDLNRERIRRFSCRQHSARPRSRGLTSTPPAHRPRPKYSDASRPPAGRVRQDGHHRPQRCPAAWPTPPLQDNRDGGRHPPMGVLDAIQGHAQGRPAMGMER